MSLPRSKRLAQLCGFTAFLLAASALLPPCAYASEGGLKARVETNIRAGTERTILMTEAWVPLAQERDRVLYGDVRLMGDDGDNREWNFGLGYRGLNAPGDAVLGVHGWFDRRRSTRGSVFHQVAGGVEYLSGDLDVRLNGYIPFNEEERYTIAGGSTTPYLADTGIFYDTNGLLVEKPLHGFDVEFSLPVKALENTFDSFRVSAGGFVFSGDDVETLRGVRLRAAADVTSDLQIGARFETDNQRGAQAFAEATLRFPFGSKASNRTLGLRSRLDESPERDIDIITSAKVAVAATQRNAVTSSFDGLEQRVFHVDNTAAAGGDGSLSNPFNTLAAANAAANRPGDVIYLNRGDGTTAGQNQGVTLAHQGQALIGSGVDFVYDSTRFTAGAGANFTGALLRAASAAPVITNVTLNGDGVRVLADNTLLAGFDVLGATRDGLSILNAQGTQLQSFTSNSNGRHGYYALTNDGVSRTVSFENLSTSNNGGSGIRVEANGLGHWSDVGLRNIVSTGNAQQGVYVLALSSGQIGTATLQAITAQNNTGTSGRGVEVRAEGVGSTITSSTISDVTATGNAQQGVLVYARSSGQIGSAQVQDVTATGNAQQGVYVLALSSGQIGSAQVQDVTATGNAQQGVYVLALSSGQIGTATLQAITAQNNTGTSGRGVEVRAEGVGSTITSSTISDVTATGNAQQGVYVLALSSGQIGTATLQAITAQNNTGTSGRGVEVRAEGVGSTITSSTISDVTATGNAQQGVYVLARSSGQIGSAQVQDVTATGNAQQGIYLYAVSSGSLSASLERVTATGNGTNGVFVDDDTTGSFVVDLGGGALGSTGGNRIFGNTGTDLRVDLDGLELKAENNWWGNAAGLLPGRVTLDVGSTVDFTPWLVTDPGP